jgi:hypothetical protein
VWLKEDINIKVVSSYQSLAATEKSVVQWQFVVMVKNFHSDWCHGHCPLAQSLFQTLRFRNWCCCQHHVTG